MPKEIILKIWLSVQSGKLGHSTLENSALAQLADCATNLGGFLELVLEQLDGLLVLYRPLDVISLPRDVLVCLLDLPNGQLSVTCFESLLRS